MTRVKFLDKKIIDNTLAREYDKTISDGVMLTFEVKLIVDKDWYDKTHNEDSILIGESDGRVSSWFGFIYKHIYQLIYKNSIAYRDSRFKKEVITEGDKLLTYKSSVI